MIRKQIFCSSSMPGNFHLSLPRPSPRVSEMTEVQIGVNKDPTSFPVVTSLVHKDHALRPGNDASKNRFPQPPRLA